MAGRAVAAFVCLLAVGCARLPDVPTANLHDATPRVVAPSGELSKSRREALLERQDKPDEPTLLARHLVTLRQISGAPLTSGNAARLLVDGPSNFAAIFRAIGAARDHVDIETYILEGDEFGEKLLALLAEKESQGVQVNLLYDALGSRDTPDEFIERLRAGGVNVCEFNPLLPSRGRMADPSQRDHRKQVIVDGRLAISGGINLSNAYSSGSGVGRSTEGWTPGAAGATPTSRCAVRRSPSTRSASSRAGRSRTARISRLAITSLRSPARATRWWA